MPESIDSILRSTPQVIVERGEAYYADGYIKSATLFPGGTLVAEVAGSGGECYDVRIDIDEAENISAYSCTCPYDYGDVCKHLVAVFLAYKNGEYSNHQKKSAKNEADLPEIIAAIPDAKIKEFVIQYARTDDFFRSELLLACGKPQMDAEMTRIKERVRIALRRGTHSGYIDYSGCDFICDELMDILNVAEKRIMQGQIILAFHIALYMLLTGMKLASTADSSSGYLNETIGRSLEILDRACEDVEIDGSADDKKVLYEKLVKEARNKVFDGWGTWNYELLRFASRFVTEKNKRKLFDSLDYLMNLYSQKEFMRYHDADDKLTRLAVMRRLEGDERADEYIKENLHIDEIRRIAVNNAVADGDYIYAEQLCREKLANCASQNPYARPSEWYYSLFTIYEKSASHAKQTEIAETLTLLGDLKYYGILKNLLTKDGTWDEKHPGIRGKCAENLPYYDYMKILEQESEWQLLFAEVKNHPATVFTYGKQLAAFYADGIYKIYREQIIRQAAEASDRKNYKKVCTSIKQLHEAGGSEASLALIGELRATFARRPAMIEELGKLRGRLRP